MLPLEANAYIDAYEAAQSRGLPVDLAEFLPTADHPLYREVLRELVRVDLEYGWQRGEPTPLDAYQRQFPDLFADPAAVADIAFEEYRLRDQAGQDPSPAEYEDRYGFAARTWPRRKRPRSDAQTGSVRDGRTEVNGKPLAGDAQVIADIPPMPKVGDAFLNFNLIAELGRGGFGRVFLATQGDLAHRLVALKISVDLFGEEQKLAQLQHTHVVPIYSMHQEGALQAVCMPYFGATTLADVLEGVRGQGPVPSSAEILVSTVLSRQGEVQLQVKANPTDNEPAVETPPAPTATLTMLQGMSHIDAVLWIGERLADGLQHAHERGILHRDLKPANILLTDDGQPMLLDFNLSADIKGRAGVSAMQIGGTLPYMAPEHLEVFRSKLGAVDARSDVYALGVILFELLIGQLPFTVRGPLSPEGVGLMIADRQQPPPSARARERAISPATDAILRKCLEPDPAKRYQTAEQLREDLHRQRLHLPLLTAAEPSFLERTRKWCKRHPRLASPMALGGLAAILIAAAVVPTAWIVWENSRKAQAEAAKLRDEADKDLGRARAVQEDARKKSEQLDTLTRQTEQRQAAIKHYARFEAMLPSIEALAEELNLLHLSLEEAPPALKSVDRHRGVCQEALAHYGVLDNPAWREQPIVSALPAARQSVLVVNVGDLLYLLARAELTRLARGDKQAPEQIALAERYHTRALALHPKDKTPLALELQRGQLTQLRGAKAVESGHATARGPRDAYWSAGEEAARGRFAEALVLLREANQKQPDHFGTWLLLGLCQQHLADHHKAKASFSTCIALRPDFVEGHFHRGFTLLRLREFEGAESDFDRVLSHHATRVPALVHRAAALEGQRKFPRAIEDLTRALRQQADQPELYFLRSRLHQQAGDEDRASADQARVLRTPPTTAQGWTYRGVARAATDQDSALADFDQALKLIPDHLPALYHKARVLGEGQRKPAEGVAVLDLLVRTYEMLPRPQPADKRVYHEALLLRGGLRAALGDRAQAQRDLEFVYNHEPTHAVCFQMAKVYARMVRDLGNANQKAMDRDRAIKLLAYAIRDRDVLPRINGDPDLARLQQHRDFQKLLEALTVLPSDPPPRMRVE